MASTYAQIVVKAHADQGTEAVVKKSYNVYTFRRTVTTGTPSKSQIRTAFLASIQAAVEAALSVSYIGDSIDVRFLDDPLDPYVTATYAGAGAIAGDSLPSINAVTIQLKTGVRGRSFRGSKHYSPVAESDTTLDHLVAGAVTRYTAIGTAILAGFTDAGGYVWVPFLVSQKKSVFNPTTATVVGADITGFELNEVLGEMKRRKQPHLA